MKKISELFGRWRRGEEVGIEVVLGRTEILAIAAAGLALAFLAWR